MWKWCSYGGCIVGKLFLANVRYFVCSNLRFVIYLVSISIFRLLLKKKYDKFLKVLKAKLHIFVIEQYEYVNGYV